MCIHIKENMTYVCIMAAYHYVITLLSIALTYVNCQAMPYFYTSSHKGIFSEKLPNIKCVFWFPL